MGGHSTRLGPRVGAAVISACARCLSFARCSRHIATVRGEDRRCLMGKTQEQVTAGQDRSARTDLPLLEELAQELEALVRDMFTPPIVCQSGNSADLMALSFATKQHE